MRITEPFLDVLNALLEAPDRELHGYAIIKETKRQPPTVYKLLERLRDALITGVTLRRLLR